MYGEDQLPQTYNDDYQFSNKQNRFILHVPLKFKNVIQIQNKLIISKTWQMINCMTIFEIDVKGKTTTFIGYFGSLTIQNYQQQVGMAKMLMIPLF